MTDFTQTISNLLASSVPLIAALVVIGLIVAIWLVIRKIKLWYWKVNERVVLLEDLNVQLANLRRDMAEARAEKSEAKQPEEVKTIVVQEAPKAPAVAEPPVAPVEPEEAPAAPAEPEVPEVKEAPELPPLIPEADVQEEKTEKKRVFNVDKRGRIYTEEEINNQIKD